MSLEHLGFSRWFNDQWSKEQANDRHPARVTAVDRGSYLIRNETLEIPAELAGKLAFQTENSSEMPCVGDWVIVQYYNENTAAIIHGILPRRSFLRRKAAGNSIDYQMIAANIDVAFIVQSCHFDFNPRRLERYLVMVADGRVAPIILLTKADLIDDDERQRKLTELRSITAAPIITLSGVTGEGIAELQQTLEPKMTYCLLGSSGVGKSTLINRLLGQEILETKAVSSTGEGTHTTTRRQLLLLPHGAMLIDTPGMRELGIIGAGAEVAGEFTEFSSLAEQCRYADCSHQHEPGCAVRAAIASGALPEERFFSYQKLKKESEFHDMSYQDKRKKEKAFGRFIKSVKKHNCR